VLAAFNDAAKKGITDMSSEPHAYATTGLAQGKRPQACVLTIFGASGDLTKRKLIPALYNLALDRRLPERFAVVGCARSKMSHEEFRNKMREAVGQFSRTGLKDESVWQQFAANLYYVPADYNRLEGYQQLKDFITAFDNGGRALPARVFYLATPPEIYGTLIQHVSAAGSGHERIPQRKSDSRCHRETIRHGSAERARTQPNGPRSVGRESGLSNRPLPRQRDGAEHYGFPVC
jgi:hypothetical protein